jgi:hypothetical protein
MRRISAVESFAHWTKGVITRKRRIFVPECLCESLRAISRLILPSPPILQVRVPHHYAAMGEENDDVLGEYFNMWN